MSIDLFKVIVDEKKLHPLFKQVLNEPAYAKTHPIINEWGEGLLDRSGEAKKFVTEWQTTFNSSFWELYLNKAFKDLGYKIDYSKASPDFNLISPNNRNISVEAVTSNPSTQQTLKLDKQQIETELLDESTLKLAGKIRDKHILYMGDGKKKHPYSSLDHVQGNPFVLAVAPFDKQLAQGQNNTAINRVLYGLEPPKNYHDPQGTVKCVINKNGKEVELGIFTNDSYKEISAVIFSTTGTFGKAVSMAGIASFVRVTRLRRMGIEEFITNEGLDKLGRSVNPISDGYDIFSERIFSGGEICGHDMYFYNAIHHNETHLDGLQIYHNPYALHPLESDDFDAPEVVHYFYDTEDQTMRIKYRDHSMVSRNTVTGIA
ncbi:hypothetical protein AB4453_16965 [Vibrio atlanticus]|uniref:hypothetical protein n=1 Tax=Vibrio TaxID=662 RepID=UPI000C844E73|nr:hypothetical protein [Vibrio splendidus]